MSVSNSINRLSIFCGKFKQAKQLNMKNLNKLLEVLMQSDVDFVLIGGFAGVIHGSSFVTKDLDICISMKALELSKLRVALRDYNPRHRMNPKLKLSFLEEPKDLSSLKNLYLETDLGVLDVIGEVTGVGSFDGIKKSAEKFQVLGHECFVMSLEDLMRSKRSLGREKDLVVLKELELIQKKRR